MELAHFRVLPVFLLLCLAFIMSRHPWPDIFQGPGQPDQTLMDAYVYRGCGSWC